MLTIMIAPKSKDFASIGSKMGMLMRMNDQAFEGDYHCCRPWRIPPTVGGVIFQ
jgi:hypothetical protein